MSKTRTILLLLSLIISHFAYAATEDVKKNYTKYEYNIEMRDGVKLYTAVYVPKDQDTEYPFLLTRSPYSCSPYGEENYRYRVGPSQQFQDEKMIFVYQDARGRYMSEGEFMQVHPHLPNKKKKDIDESTDTYDTIEWLLKNIDNNNGKVGMTGISQPGFHVAASMIDSHPALVCASPQAPTADYYMGDDKYHNGAFMLAAALGFYSSFVPRTDGPFIPERGNRYSYETRDWYDLGLNLGPLSTINERYFEGKSGYIQEIIDHTTYDEYWQKRSLWKFMDNVNCAVLNVGGWFDCEDPVGPLLIYNGVDAKSPEAENHLVMGPWSHGGWSGSSKGNSLGNISFDSNTSEYYRDNIEFPFFMEHLKGKKANISKVYTYVTGSEEWREYDQWPPKDVEEKKFYLASEGALTTSKPNESEDSFDQYTSDPNRPVPHVGFITEYKTSSYVTEDQRFASQRPDVLVYETEVLESDITIAGAIDIDLFVSTTGTDADFVVKIIDVYPNDYPTKVKSRDPRAVKMGGYQQLVRGEPFRGKFRDSFTTPIPFEPGVPDNISFELPDMHHTFKKGHKIMVQIQSSWFPLVDRNPQQFMHIPDAKAEDFKKADHKVYRGGKLQSSITFKVEE